MEQEFFNQAPDPRGKPALMRMLSYVDRLILKGWRVFTSLKFGIFLLIMIGVAAIYGTMGYASNAALGDNGIPMARVHFFESRLFVALLMLFAINLIMSTWHVTLMSFGIWWKRDFRRGKTYYEHGSSPRAEIPVPGGPEEVDGYLRKRFTRAHRDGNAFFAHSGLISRMGPTIVHIGMLTVIFAMVTKAFLLWNNMIVTEGRFLAAEGETSSVLHEPVDTAQQITDLNRRERNLGIWITVLDFDEIKHPNSEVPAYFSSLVEVRDPVSQKVTVAQLDMNNSLQLRTDLGTLKFHQASFIPDPEFQRMNFDVRDRATGERIAVSDAQPETRVRVGDTTLFLEVDGIAPASRWRLYDVAAPKTVVAEGLLTGGREMRYAFQPVQFFPDFRISDDTRLPYNASDEPRNPALQVDVFLDDQRVDTTWLFIDPQLAALMPNTHPKFRLELQDVRVLRGKEMETIDWTSPDSALFVVAVNDQTSNEAVGHEMLSLNEKSRDFNYTSTVDHATADLGTENGYEVRIIGPTQRFVTVLSVVSEPTVPFVNLGVILVVIGAIMTFVVRYRAFYGLWDPASETLRMALVPRWGQSPVQEEFDAITSALSHGAGPATRQKKDQLEKPDEVAPEHETVNPSLAEV